MRYPAQVYDGASGGKTAGPACPRDGEDCDCAPRLLAPSPQGPRTPIVPGVRRTEDWSPPPRRRRIWELGESLHCSIVGTCLSTDELRRLLRKLGRGAADETDHALHGLAVGLAGRRDTAAKLLHKALDERHRVAIRRFDGAGDRESLRRLWQAAVDVGDIPGSYWAVLTHPCADQPLIAEAFGEVHMLSHLVGAANRADIRRLAMQERELTTLRETVARQQARLRTDLTERDARIRALQDLLAGRSGDGGDAAHHRTHELEVLVADLRARLDRAQRRGEGCARRAEAAETALQEERGRRQRLEKDLERLIRELAVAETACSTEPAETPVPTMRGTVLYVGGRTGQTAALRRAAARCGAELLHHDAEQGSALLPGLVGRADLVVFPVDCVSHDAALAVKRLCRKMGRPFQALRSTGTASLLAALHEGVAEAG